MTDPVTANPKPTPTPVPPQPAPPKPAPLPNNPALGFTPANPHPYVGKTIANLKAEQPGSIFTLELTFTDGTKYYVKTKQGVVEHGGTALWGTGTRA